MNGLLLIMILNNSPKIGNILKHMNLLIVHGINESNNIADKSLINED